MTLNLEDEYGLELGIDYEGTASLVISQVLEEEGCPYEAEVNLLLTSNEPGCGPTDGCAFFSTGRV